MSISTRRSFANPLRAAANLFRPMFGGEAASPTSVSPVEQRRRIFDLNYQYYANTVYNRILDKGSLDFVNETLGESAARDLAGVFNPVERVVELYADNVFNERWGHGFDVLDVVGTKRNERAVNETILDPLDQIADWSNFDTELKDYARKTALFGTSGIRVVARVGANYPQDRLEDRRVFLQFEHPSVVESVVEDERGNVQQIVTEALKPVGELSLDDVDSATRVQTVVERTLMTKTEFRVVRGESAFDFVSAQLGGATQTRPNALGVTPYVLARHRKLGGTWGAWAHFGKEPMINKTNALSAHIDRQIHRHVNVTTVVAAKGKPPVEFDFSGRRVVYVELTEGATPPAFEHLVSNLSLADAILKLTTNLAELGNALPELKALDGDYLSGQSGETVAQLTKPAAQKIYSARLLSEDALKRALKMALSWGILLGIFKIDFLTGDAVPATREACDLAFRSGAFDFDFDARPALPSTESERLAQEQLQLEVDDLRAQAEGRAAAGVDEPTDPLNPPPQGAGGALDQTGDNAPVVA